MEVFTLELNREQMEFLLERLQAAYSDHNKQALLSSLHQAISKALEEKGLEVADNHYVPHARPTPIHPDALNLLAHLRTVDSILRRSVVSASKEVVERWDALLQIGPFRRDFKRWRDAGYPYGEHDPNDHTPPEGRLRLLLED